MKDKKYQLASILQKESGELVLMRKHRSVETGIRYCQNYISYALTGKFHGLHHCSRKDIYLAKVDMDTQKVVEWIW